MSLLKLGNLVPCGAAFRLPIELVTQSIAILAKRGVGKTYTAAVISEEIHDAGVPPVIIDPTGAHWGLKASADGKRAGLPFVVFGGEHADLPLEEGAGEVIARAIVDQRFPAIIDLSLLRKAATHRFLVGFFEALYRLNRQAVHLVCDEADAYAPQKPYGEEMRTLGAMQDIVRRGRIRGIGCTLITQRPQVLNKDVLTQCEVLVTMRLVHPKDIGAIEEWVAVHGDPAIAKEMIGSLPSLPIGHAWFWWPSADIFARVHIRQRRTFDSSATPKPGEARVAPEKFADVDLARLGGEIAAAAQRAKENDPAELKRQIADLKRQLAAKPAAAPVPAECVEIPIVDDHARRLFREAAENASQLKAALDALRGQVDEMVGQIREGSVRVDDAVRRFAGRGGATPTRVGVPNRNDTGQAPRERVSARPIARDARPQTASAGNLSKAERLVLTCLAQFGECSKNKVAAITGYAVNGGGFNNSLSALRSRGFITASDPMAATDAGVSALGTFDPLPTGPALIAHWERQLSKAEASIFRYVCDCYPHASTKEEIAGATGYEANGGGFNNALSRLRTLELITRGTEIRASENLFA